MNVLYWKRKLQEKYGGKIKNFVLHGATSDGEDADELIGEIEPGFAVALIHRSRPHFHLLVEEQYLLREGRLAVIRAGHATAMGEESEAGWISIPPGVVHQVVSLQPQAALVEVCSDPVWSPDDHFEV